MKTLCVFLVDDDEDDRELFCETLNRISDSITCTTFSSGHEALQVLQSTIKPPDFIFLDLNMPRLNGRQCLEIIKSRKELSQIPVIIYSTSRLAEDIAETKKLGANYFITKPTDLINLRKELEFVLTNNWKE